MSRYPNTRHRPTVPWPLLLASIAVTTLAARTNERVARLERDDAAVAYRSPRLLAGSALTDAAPNDFTTPVVRVPPERAARWGTRLRIAVVPNATLARNCGDAITHAASRSWHLLPATIAIARIRLRAGDHALAADVDGSRVSIADVHALPLVLPSSRLVACETVIDRSRSGRTNHPST